MTQALKALKAAKKSTTSSAQKDRLYYEATPEVAEICEEIAKADKAKKEADKKHKHECVNLRAIIDPWRTEKCESGEHENTVDVLADDLTIQIQYKNQYSPFGDDAETHLREVTGDKYDRLFKEGGDLKVKKSITENPEKLEALVGKLLEVMSAADFAEYFEHTPKILCKPNFDRDRYAVLSKDQNMKLGLMGLKQTVACYTR